MSKKKIKRYWTVKLVRTVRFVAEIEVEAHDSTEAVKLAEAEADVPRANHWRETDVISEDTPECRENTPS